MTTRGSKAKAKTNAKGSGKAGKIDCMKCEHFFVTWEKKFPRGCSAYGFKGKNMPSIDVLSSSGTECQLFLPRSKKEGKK